MQLRTKLLSGNGLVLGLLLTTSMAVYFGVVSFLNNVYWVNHTKKVSAKPAAVDMETGTSG
jgi:hypothetical protein